MYASIRHYRMGAGSIDEAMHLADTQLADRLSAEPGFVEYQVLAMEDDTILSITVFDDEQQCARSNDLAAEFVRDHLAPFDLERIEMVEGEVMVSRAAERVLEAAHH